MGDTQRKQKLSTKLQLPFLHALLWVLLSAVGKNILHVSQALTEIHSLELTATNPEYRPKHQRKGLSPATFSRGELFVFKGVYPPETLT